MALSLSINYLYILIATIASFILGWIWYGPLFGKTWLKLNGRVGAGKKMKKPESSEMTKSMILSFAGTFIMVYIFSAFIFLTGMASVSGVITLALLLWVGFFVCTTMLGSVLWDMKPWKLFFLNSTYWLVNLIIIGLVLISF